MVFDAFVNNPTLKEGTFHLYKYNSSPVVVRKASKGDTFKVTHIVHGYSAFGDRVDVQTDFAYFDGLQYVPLNEYQYTFNKELRSGWSQSLGNLMSFVFWPIYLMYICIPYLLYRAFMFFKKRVIVGDEL